MNKIFLYALAALVMTAVTPAFAEEAPVNQKPTQVYVHRTYEHQEDDRFDHRYIPNLGRAGEIAISANDKIVIGKYLNHYYKTTCVPDQRYHVKKCLVPKYPETRAYIIGYALPSDVVAEEIPAKVIYNLHPLPYGYKYVRVNDDVVLINASSREVIDAVTLYSVYVQ